jgi:hypothetical protein
MSTLRELEAHSRTKASSAVPLEVIAELIEDEVGAVQRESGGVFFDGTIGTTHIRVTPVDVDTIDGGRIANIVSIVTELPELPIPSTDQALAAYNMGAGFSAAIRDEETGCIQLVSRLSCFEDDDEAWSLYVPMIVFAAMYQSDTFVKFLAEQYIKAHAEPESEIAKAVEPSRWGAEDFELTQEQLDQFGVYANGGEGGLTAEFPWDAGAVSSMDWLVSGGERKRTSLLTLTTEESHPCLGNGLFCRLVIPISYSFEEATGG